MGVRTPWQRQHTGGGLSSSDRGTARVGPVQTSAEWNNKVAPLRYRTRCVEKFDTPPYDRLSELGLFNDTVSAVTWRRKRRQYDREWGVDKISKQGRRYENQAHKGPWLLKEIARLAVNL